MTNDALSFYQLVRDFLTIYLPKQRGVSPNTTKSYKEALNLFIDYIGTAQDMPLKEISFGCVSREQLDEFLLWLETGRKCRVSSRNQRMSAVKSFIRYAAEKDRTLMPLYLEVAAVKKKKDIQVHEIEFFSESALETILAQPDRNKKNGQRDLVFMILLYDTGARTQELLDLRVGDVYLTGRSHFVTVTGKGSKTRTIPIMEKTCSHLESYQRRFHAEKRSDEYLFYIDRKGVRSQMSIDNVEKFIARYGKMAHEASPKVPEHIYPHMWRHSRAVHLYRNGMPLPLVAEWLGHAKMDTTRRFYANADTTMKREAISKATSYINPLFSDAYDIDWEDDVELIKKLYCLK